MPNHPRRNPATDMNSREIAQKYGVDVMRAGHWFRGPAIPAAQKYIVAAERKSGNVDEEWRAIRAYMEDEFKRPRGGRPPKSAQTDEPVDTTLVLTEGDYTGYSLSEIYQLDPDYLRQIAWGPQAANALIRFVQGKIREYLTEHGETMPPSAPKPAPTPQGRRLIHIPAKDDGAPNLYIDLVDDPPASATTHWFLEHDGVVAECALPLDDSRVLAVELAEARFTDLFTHYGGAQHGDKITSAALAVKDRSPDDQLRYPIVLTITVGPGKAGAEGIRPLNDPFAKTSLSLALTRYESRRLGLALRDHFIAALLR